MSATPGYATFTAAVANDGLIDRLRRGEASAIGEAYDLHASAVMAFARRLLGVGVGEDAAAEDLLHEVFVTLPSAVKRFEGGSSLRTFLIAIAVNHARHHVRAATRRRAAMSRYSREPENESGTPEQEVMRVDLARALTLALDALPIDQRVAFVLCEVEDRTSREVSEIVGAPEGTVRTRVFHAKRKLRDELAERGIR